jgi:hypothetical protein
MNSTGYIKLREEMLNFHSEDVKVSPGSDYTLKLFFQDRSYSVRNINGSRKEFDAVQSEINFHVFNEIENLMNHCYAHFVELSITKKHYRSHAWSAVTLYYLAFFTSSVFLRLCGRPVTFFDKGMCKIINSTQSEVNFQAGPYVFRKDRSLSATHVCYTVKKEDKIHESSWKNLFKVLEIALDEKSSGKIQHSEDFQIFLLCKSRNLFDSSVSQFWPSDLRNKVNYVPGYYYTLKENNFVVEKAFNEWFTGAHEQVELLDGSIRLLERDSRNVQRKVEALAYCTFSLFGFVRMLYKDLRLRKTVDSRWERGRVDFLNKHKIPDLNDSTLKLLK